MLTNVTPVQKILCVNTVIDSLYLRVLRQCIPSNWLKAQLPRWQAFQQTADYDSDPYMVYIPMLGTFELKAFGKQPYRYILVNKDVANILVWCPEKWETAVSSQTGQFLIEFRSKYLQAHSLPGVRSFVENLVRTFTCQLLCDRPFGWDRISRVDLATDTQLERSPKWDDLKRYVSRSRKNEGDSDSLKTQLEQARELVQTLKSNAPPTDNKGGATYNLTAEQLDLLLKTLESVSVPELEDGYLYRVLFQREIQSMYFGRFASALHAIRYDKLASLETQKKNYLKDVWRSNGWDGQSPVWRTEFRLKAPFLRQAGLILGTGEKLQDMRDFKVFCRYIHRIWSYLTHDWLRLTVPSDSDSNQWRWELDDEWKVVQAAFFHPDKIKRYPLLKNPIDAQMVAQMRGVALTLTARRAKWDGDREAAIDVLNDLATWFSDTTFDRRLAERRELLGCDDFTHAAIADELRAEWLLEGEGS